MQSNRVLEFLLFLHLPFLAFIGLRGYAWLAIPECLLIAGVMVWSIREEKKTDRVILMLELGE